MNFIYIEYIPPPFKRKKILPVRPKIFENEKEKRKILNSPKDGPIATQLQVRRITNRSNHRSSSPRIFFTSPQTFSCTKKKKKKEKKWRSFSSTHVHEPRRDEFIRGSGRSTEVGNGAIVEQNCCRFPVPSRVLVPVLARKPERRCDRLLRRTSRADSRNRARENERRRARVVAVWPGTGGHPAVYLPFDATCWIQRAKHGRGGGGRGERSTSARGVATPTPTRAACKRSSVKDEAEGRFYTSSIRDIEDRGSIFSRRGM